LPNGHAAAGVPRFITRFLPTRPRRRQAVDVEVVVVFGVGDRRLAALLHVARDARLREGEVGQRLVDLLAADLLATRFSFCGLMRSMRSTAIASLSATRRGFFSLPMAYFLFAFLSAA
jgi:hypothetical protein